MAANAEPLNRRALAKERRRQQLIDATIKCISKKGLGGTTLADVAGEAGLSQGIVNLHFDSKDNCCGRRCSTWRRTTISSFKMPWKKHRALRQRSCRHSWKWI